MASGSRAAPPLFSSENRAESHAQHNFFHGIIRNILCFQNRKQSYPPAFYHPSPSATFSPLPFPPFFAPLKFQWEHKCRHSLIAIAQHKTKPLLISNLLHKPTAYETTSGYLSFLTIIITRCNFHPHNISIHCVLNIFRINQHIFFQSIHFSTNRVRSE